MFVDEKSKKFFKYFLIWGSEGGRRPSERAYMCTQLRWTHPSDWNYTRAQWSCWIIRIFTHCKWLLYFIQESPGWILIECFQPRFLSTHTQWSSPWILLYSCDYFKYLHISLSKFQFYLFSWITCSILLLFYFEDLIVFLFFIWFSIYFSKFFKFLINSSVDTSQMIRNRRNFEFFSASDLG